MLQFSNLTIGTAVVNQSGAMEADTISKNGRSLKNHTSKGNFLIMLLSIFFIGFVFSGCKKADEETPTFDASSFEGVWNSEIGSNDRKFTFNNNSWIFYSVANVDENQIIRHWKGDFSINKNEIELDRTHVWRDDKWVLVTEILPNEKPLLHRYTFMENNKKLLLEYEYPEGNWNTTSSSYAGTWEREIN
jgi:hypothetical protein